MNEGRRERAARVIDRLEAVKAELEYLRDEEAEYAENMPDAFEEKREKADAAADAFDNAVTSVEDAIQYIQEGKE